MNTNRRTARATGVLFILTLVTGVAGLLAYGPVLSDPNYVIGPGADGRVFLGAFFEMLVIITNISTAVVLYPILKRQNETLAIGYVAARLVEATLILIGIVSLLSVVTMRQAATGADASSLVLVGRSLVAIHDWTFLLGPSLFGAGLGNGLLLGFLMYRSGLLPRRMALFGLVGGPLLVASSIAVLFGVIDAGSTWQGIATFPEIIWEIGIMGLWLTFKGFKVPPVITADDHRVNGATDGRREAAAVLG
jgi:hypothetical protein